VSGADTTAGPRTRLLRAKFDLRMRCGTAPVLWHAVELVNWRAVRRPHVRVTAATELVMDGFPSSGNSYSIGALRLACRQAGVAEPAVAHHLHNPGQILDGVRRHVPVLLLVREPAAAVASLVSRWPWLTVDQGLRGWARFHEHLLPAVDDMVVADFADVTSDFGAVTRRVNARFGTGFPVFDATDANRTALYSPDPEARRDRRARAAAAREAIADPANAGERERAEAAYRRLAVAAGVAGRR
jgi:hypothetical protein